MAIRDDLTINVPTQLAAQAFQICTEEWAQISITPVSRKTHLLTSRENTHLIPADLHHEIQVHDDGI